MTVRALVAYDGSSAADAAVRAAAALFPGAHAVVLHVRDVDLRLRDRAAGALAGAAADLERGAEAAGRELADAGRRAAEAAGLAATAELRGGESVWREIAAAAGEHAADVIVCGTGGRGALSRTLLGSTSASLLHHAERPVLIAPGDAPAPGGPAVLAYDDADGARTAIAVAARLLPGRPAVVVHAWSSPVDRSYAGRALELVPLADARELVGELEALVAAAADEVADAGAALARDAGLAARPRAVKATAGTWRAIAAAAADAGAAVIVAGSRGRGALAESVLGSVSAGLAHNAERPVLVVP
jgi:nucleotide-binding universal stress UspA family protein